jgi:transcriptional regulator
MTLSGVDVNVSDITPLFDPVATVQPFTQAQVGVLRKQLGVSQAQIQRELGYTDAQIEVMQIERAQETAGVGEALLSAFDAGEDSIA